MKGSPSTLRWISVFFTTFLFLAAVALLFALIYGGRSGPLVHGRGIADITVNLNGKPVREHCTTCHLRGGLPSEGDLGAVGGSHPDIAPHDWQVLGCTGCHLGEGMALDVEISHGLPGLGARKVLSGRDVQGRCFACHRPAPLEGAEKPWRGYRLFVDSACDSCHRIEHVGRAGAYGPDLSTIGSTLGLDALQKAIRDPAAEPPNSIMPRFPLSRGQVGEIAWFLKSRVRYPAYATPMELRTGKAALPPVPMAVPENLPRGGRLMATAKCLACHKFRGIDGGIGPDLTWIGSMRDREYLAGFLENPDRFIPGAIMPRTVGSETETAELVNFLDRRAVGPIEHQGHTDVAGGVAAKRNYMLLCQRCHAANGDGHGRIAPSLAQFPRPFADNAEFFRRAEDRRLMENVEKGIPGTSMPPYEGLLSRKEIDGLLDLVFASFVRVPRHRSTASLPPLPAPAPAAERTEDLYRELCMRCHGRHGNGQGPEYLEHLPRPRNLTNTPYFEALSNERIARSIIDGVPGTAMGPFRGKLSATELWGLVDQVRAFAERRAQ